MEALDKARLDAHITREDGISTRRLELAPITQRNAFAFVNKHHRHHKAPQSAIFCIAAVREDQVVGVVVVDHPVARAFCDGYTAEVRRLCTDGTIEAHNAASMLYAAAWRAARAMGYRRLLTYTLKDETGVSLVAAGWKVKYHTRPYKTWNMPNRQRNDKHPTGPKTLWEAC